MTNSAKYWIDRLGLIAHPEGGYYRETYRSGLSIAREALPAQFTGPRLVSTAIYFLLEGNNFSAFHRLRSDELWHFYAGGPIVVHVIEEKGDYFELLIGNNPGAGQVLQAVVKAGLLVRVAPARPSIVCIGRLYGCARLRFRRFRNGRKITAGRTISAACQADRTINPDLTRTKN